MFRRQKTVTYIFRRRVLVNEMAQMLWKVSFKDIIQLRDLVNTRTAPVLRP